MTWRDRAEFKDQVENILIEAHGHYIPIEIGKLNDPNLVRKPKIAAAWE